MNLDNSSSSIDDSVLWHNRSQLTCDSKIICQSGTLWVHRRIMNRMFWKLDTYVHADGKMTWAFIHDLETLENIVELCYLGKVTLQAVEIPDLLKILVYFCIPLHHISFVPTCNDRIWNPRKKYDVMIKFPISSNDCFGSGNVNNYEIISSDFNGGSSDNGLNYEEDVNASPNSVVLDLSIVASNPVPSITGGNDVSEEGIDNTVPFVILNGGEMEIGTQETSNSNSTITRTNVEVRGIGNTASGVARNAGGVQTEPQETPKNKSTFVETIVDVNRMETEISTTSAGAIQGSNVIEIGQSSKRRSNGGIFQLPSAISSCSATGFISNCSTKQKVRHNSVRSNAIPNSVESIVQGTKKRSKRVNQKASGAEKYSPSFKRNNNTRNSAESIVQERKNDSGDGRYSRSFNIPAGIIRSNAISLRPI